MKLLPLRAEAVELLSVYRRRPGGLYFWLMIPALVIFFLSWLYFCIPFFLPGPFSWEKLSLNLQALVLLLAAALLFHSFLSHRLGNASRLLIISLLISYAAEYSGISLDWTFGSRYKYHPALAPRLPGGVPLCIPLMWFVLCYPAVVFAGPLPIRYRGKYPARLLMLKASLIAVYITASDIVLDPVAVLYKAWTWQQPGSFYGVPPGNFRGWFLVGFSIGLTALLFEKPLPDQENRNCRALERIFWFATVSVTLLSYGLCILLLGFTLPVLLSLAIMAPVWIYRHLSAVQSRAGQPGC